MIRVLRGIAFSTFWFFASQASAATYVFEDEYGEFLFGQGTRLDNKTYFEKSLADYEQMRTNFVASGGTPEGFLERYGPFVIETREGYRSFATFEEFYQAEFRSAVASRAIGSWKTDGLLVSAATYFFFPVGEKNSYLGVLHSVGDSTVPRSVNMDFDSPASLVSLTLRIPNESLDHPALNIFATGTDGSVITETVPFGFDGDFNFDGRFQNISRLTLRTYRPTDAEWGLGYEMLVTSSSLPGCGPSGGVPPKCSLSPVPLPATGLLLVSALTVIGTLRVRRRIRASA